MTGVKSSACNAKELQASRERLPPIMRNTRLYVAEEKAKNEKKKEKKKFKEKQRRKDFVCCGVSKPALGKQGRD